MKSMSLILIKIRYFLRLIGVKVKKIVVKDLNELNSFWLIGIIPVRSQIEKARTIRSCFFSHQLQSQCYSIKPLNG